MGLTQLEYSDQSGSEQPLPKMLEQFLAASSQVSADAAAIVTAPTSR
jgi:hypothetical protein